MYLQSGEWVTILRDKFNADKIKEKLAVFGERKKYLKERRDNRRKTNEKTMKKKNIKINIVKSLRFRIIVLLILVSSIPCFVIKETVLNKYEHRAVAWRMAEIQNQCTILCNLLCLLQVRLAFRLKEYTPLFLRLYCLSVHFYQDTQPFSVLLFFNKLI